MGVRGTEQSELEGIGSNGLIDGEAAEKAAPRVAALTDLCLLGASSKCLRVSLEARKVVLWRKTRMGFGVALELTDLGQGLPSHSRGRVRRRNRLPFAVDLCEHRTLAQVRVVRNRQKISPHPRAGLFEPAPQVFWAPAVERAERFELIRLLCAVLHHDDAMHTLPVEGRSPFPADERGERAGRVVALRGFDDVTPGDCRIEIEVAAEVLGVVRQHHEVERLFDLHLGFRAWVNDRKSFGPAVRRVRICRVVAHGVGVR